MNKLYKSLVYDGQVSLSVLETTQLVQSAIKIHNLADGPAKILGEMLTACAYMAGCLKSERGAVSLTVKSGGGSATVSVSGDAEGHIRGYIDGGEGGLKGGTLTVIKDDGFSRPFVGTCELKAPDVSENLMQYFHMSEQIPTAVAIGADVRNGVCRAAGGVVMQLLPGTSEENMDRAEERMQAFVNPTQIVEEYGADGIIENFFKGETDRCGLYMYFPEYKCNCSREKIAGVVVSLGRKEVEDIIAEEGAVKVHCHYCNRDYVFGEEDVEELFGK